MKLSEIVAPSMKELFIKEIETLILSGKLKVGEKLPPERDMADQMKVSRTITNAGLNELARKGFIEIIPRKGTFVADYRKRGTLEALLAVIQFNGGRFDRVTFQSLMDFRRLLEIESAGLAAANRAKKDLDELQTILARLQDCRQTMEAVQLNLDFRHAMICASGNNIYPLVMNVFQNINMVFSETVYRHADAAEEAAQLPALRQLVEAIAKQDVALARGIMTQIIDNQVRALEERYYTG